MEQGSDQLATLLFQISSPAHIPWGDQRWQEVLHGYDVWVHIDADNPLMERACQSMTKHAELSSNLAALSLHVTRMLRDLVHDIRTLQSEAGKQSNGTNRNEEALVDDFSKRISSVAKARATAGALNLLRLLCHPVIVEACRDPHASVNTLKEVFTYHTRGDLAADQPAGFPLIHSLLDLIAVLGTRTGTLSSTESDVLRTPEIYDAAIFAFQLFFVLCGTQLYQPFYSSFESDAPCHYFMDELFRRTNDENGTTTEDESHNSQLFWSSDKSVGSSTTRSIGNGSSQRSKRRNRHKHKRNKPGRPKIWTPKAILETCLGWQLDRPQAPDRSIAQYYYILAQSTVDAKGGEKPGQDGLYENHMIVQATAPDSDTLASENGTMGNESGGNTAKHVLGNGGMQATKKNFIVDTTKGIVKLSGTIIFLPFRLLNLMYGALTTNKKNGSHALDRAMAMKKLTNPQYSRTRDILWLSDSLLADLGCSAILFFASNNRNGEKGNIFRMELKHLTDNRWNQGTGGSNLPDLPNFRSEEEGEGSVPSMYDQNQKQPLSIDPLQRIVLFAPASGNGDTHLTVNFESLFVSFGNTLHNELGALLLYTIIQSSPSFAEWLAVPSDMDSIVMPLLRTLYFAFRSNTFMAKDYGSKKGSRGTTKSKPGTTVSDIRDCPFRSESQLYVIIILLLLFSQDSSFGRDVFRRVTVVNVPWYKERTLKGINLGSVIILTLLRSLIFNLNRLSDVFLLNNCLAVLENLSPSVADLHEYAAMRLVSVTIILMKKYAKLVVQEKRDAAKHTPDEDNLSNPLDMYSEATRTLLGIIKHGLSAKNIESNAHLIYALVYHQVDFLKLCKTKYSAAKKNGGTSVKKLYSSKQTSRITSVIAKASELIQDESARSAPRVLRVIEREMMNLKGVIVAVDQEIANKRKKYNNHLPDGDDVQNGMNGKYDDGNVSSLQPSATATEEEFTFLYEEEADPEVFFVPYLWDIIVCVVTAGSMEWKKDDIKAFALLDEVDAPDLGSLVDPDIPTTGNFSQNADEMV